MKSLKFTFEITKEEFEKYKLEKDYSNLKRYRYKEICQHDFNIEPGDIITGWESCQKCRKRLREMSMDTWLMYEKVEKVMVAEKVFYNPKFWWNYILFWLMAKGFIFLSTANKYKMSIKRKCKNKNTNATIVPKK
jgi:hypothetical protein